MLTMEDQPPALQLANTDSAGPVRRRRAALSCVECRRRKVKCDRERPCGPCTKTRSPTCTFRPNARPNPEVVGRPIVSSTSEPASHGSSNLSSPRISKQTQGFDALLNRYIAPGIFGHHGKDTLAPLPSSHAEGNDPNTAATIKSLSDKVRDLEARLATLSEVGSSGSGSVSIPIRDAPTAPAGQFVKSKFYGESHWVNCIEPYEALGRVQGTIDINPQNDRHEFNKGTKLYATMLECKHMARTIKTARVSHPIVSPDVLSSIPIKEVCDQLVQCYLRTFEGVFRILHAPSFFKEYETYWSNTATTKPSVLIKILLVCAIGTPFFTGPERPQLRTACVEWIHAAESWLSAPHEKSRLNMAGLQIHILLILARQVCSVDGDLVWIPAGALLRSAMHLGLHRDPANFPKISTFHGEMRRRLWATVLEITAQSSLDMGMPPLISCQDFDTLPPSNINDEDISEGSTTPLEVKSPGTFTQTSIQIATNQTLPMRLDIIRLINNLRSDLSYDDVLRIGAEILTSCRTNTHRFQSHLTSIPTSPVTASTSTNAFQLKLLDVLTRRFVLCLHRPFFSKAKTDPKFYYSRKICLDTSVAILSPINPAQAGDEAVDDDWRRLITHSVGFVKSFFLYTLSTVYLELEARIQELHLDDPIISQPTTLDTLSTTSTIPPLLPPDFHKLRAILEDAKSMTLARMTHGETNCKGTLFLACALARIDALISHTDAEAAVLLAAENGIAECAAIMRSVNSDLGVDVIGALGVGGGGVEFGRGEGADMVFGAGIPGGGEGVGQGWEMDMDWEALMQDESLGFGGVGFEGSPESWFVGFEGVTG